MRAGSGGSFLFLWFVWLQYLFTVHWRLCLRNLCSLESTCSLPLLFSRTLVFGMRRAISTQQPISSRSSTSGLWALRNSSTFSGRSFYGSAFAPGPIQFWCSPSCFCSLLRSTLPCRPRTSPAHFTCLSAVIGSYWLVLRLFGLLEPSCHLWSVFGFPL